MKKLEINCSSADGRYFNDISFLYRGFPNSMKGWPKGKCMQQGVEGVANFTFLLADCSSCMSSSTSYIELSRKAKLIAYTIVSVKPSSFANVNDYIVAIG